MNLRGVLAIDQGTTNTKALLVAEDGRVLAPASAPLTSAYPQPAWAEQSGEAIWASVQSVIARIVASGMPIDAVAIANQRETLVVWDARSSMPICPAILWQCRRTADICDRLIAGGHDPDVVAATGLGINPLFPASKLGWVMAHVPAAAERARTGHLRAGTVDAWLLWNLTGGQSFATDHSNASRTQLFNTRTLTWDAALCDLFNVPMGALAAPMPSDSRFGETAWGVTDLPAGVPVLAMMGDSHAALYGHGMRAPGTVKATYGTGSSLMTLTPGRVGSAHGLSGTIAWTTRDGTAHALEGNITVSAQAAAYMAKMLGLADAGALSDLAQTVTGSHGVTFVPALAGLGAPHWDDHATGAIDGLTLGSAPAHVARATFEAIAFQIADVFAAMEADVGARLESLRADGGASRNDFLMQLQADLLGREVLRADIGEVGALGVASMAFSSMEGGTKAVASGAAPRVFHPALPEAQRAAQAARWKRAVGRAKSGRAPT